MRALRDFSQTSEFAQFAAAVTGAMSEYGAPLFLHGFVVARPRSWVLLRKERREGWATHDLNGGWSPVLGGIGQEEYFTGDSEDRGLREAWKARFNDARQPFLVKVCVAPTTPDFVALRATLADICADERRFFAVVEDRAPAYLAALEGGRSMTAATTPGTIGGFLEDQYGAKIGLTCGHVGKAVGDATSAQDAAGSTAAIGRVVETNWPLAASTGLCQPSTAGNSVDIALSDVAGGQTPTNRVRGIGAITGILPLSGLGSGHRVQMTGAVTSTFDYDVTGYVVTYRTHHNGTFYCFRNVFEISGVIINSLFSTTTPVPKLGDSGAWVCCPDFPTGSALCGMLFAVDHARGYVAFTDEMLAWASGAGRQLSTF